MSVKSLVFPALAALLLLLAALIAFLVYAAHQQDEAALENEYNLILLGIEQKAEALKGHALDNAWRNTSFKKLVAEKDKSWALETLSSAPDRILDLDGLVIYASDHSLILDQTQAVAPHLKALEDAGLSEAINFMTSMSDGHPITRSGTLIVDNQLILYGASTIHYNSEAPLIFKDIPAYRPVVVFLSFVGSDDWADLGLRLGIRGLEPFQTSSDRRAQASEFMGHQLPIALTWESRKPGTVFLARILIPALLLSGLALSIFAFFILQAMRTVRQLQAANRTQTEFLAIMSHELRTPLNAIIGYSEILASDRLKNVEKDLEYINIILKSGQHLLAIINDLLDLSKLEIDQYIVRNTNLNIDELIEDSLSFVATRAQAGQITVQKSIKPASVCADARVIRQVLLNIFSNAIKFTAPGGRIKITGDLSPSGSNYQISIHDTGCGMTPQEIEVAVAMFGRVENSYQRRTNGTGLGLPLCVRLMKRIGGSLLISSQKNKGTKITLCFPRKNKTDDEDTI